MAKKGGEKGGDFAIAPPCFRGGNSHFAVVFFAPSEFEVLGNQLGEIGFRSACCDGSQSAPIIGDKKIGSEVCLICNSF